MKKWRETTVHTLDIGVWSAEIRSSTSKNEKHSLLLLTMPAPSTVPNNLMFSYSFLSKVQNTSQRYVALSKTDWAANHYRVAVTCLTSLRDCVWTSLATVTTWRKLEPPESSSRSLCIYMDTEFFLFAHTYYWPIPILCTSWANLLSILQCHFLESLIKTTICAHKSPS